MGAVRILGCLCVRQTLQVTTHCRSPWCMGSIRGGCKCQLQVSAWVQAAAGSQRRKQALAAVRHLVCRLAGAA